MFGLNPLGSAVIEKETRSQALALRRFRTVLQVFEIKYHPTMIKRMLVFYPFCFQISQHLSDTRYRAWPRVKQFIQDLEPGSILCDVGKTNQAWFFISVNNQLRISGTCQTTAFTGVDMVHLVKCQMSAAGQKVTFYIDQETQRPRGLPEVLCLRPWGWVHSLKLN